MRTEIKKTTVAAFLSQTSKPQMICCDSSDTCGTITVRNALFLKIQDLVNLLFAESLGEPIVFRHRVDRIVHDFDVELTGFDRWAESTGEHWDDRYLPA